MADDAAPPLFEYDGGPWPFGGTVKVGGHEMASVTSFDIHAAPDGVPVITLSLVDLGALKLLFTSGRVQVADATRDALIALGWTPPAG